MTTYLLRIGLFSLTNLAVVLLLGILLRVTGVDLLMGSIGIHPVGLLAFSGLFGFAGALISLVLSKWIALRSTGARVLTRPRSRLEARLLETVQRQSRQLAIGMPDVALYESPEPNAFATGARRDAALVAVSTGLLHALSEDEVEAVLAHELSHIANGDMVTMTLLQGVTNTFVIFFARVAGYLVDMYLSGNNDRRRPGPAFWLTSMVAEVLFGLLASMIVMAWSRHREFRADAGAARLVGAPAMIAALERLAGVPTEPGLPRSLATFGIQGSGWARLFSSHPRIRDRIEALDRLALPTNHPRTRISS
jgi:heat shock protein HtpX